MRHRRTIEDGLNSAGNNLDALRFLAAFGVIVSHAFPVVQGLPSLEILESFSGGQTTIGELSIHSFFEISGLLVAMSFQRTRDFATFLSNRMVRIVPGLVVMVLLTTFVLGPLCTTLPLADFLRSRVTYRYLGNALIYPLSQALPGVFADNPISLVNASLWTLCYEFTCYTGLAAIGCLLRRQWIPAVAFLAFSAAAVLFTYISPRIFVELAAHFLMGSLIYIFRKSIVLDGRVCAFIAAALVATLLLGHGFRIAALLGGPYVLFYLAFTRGRRLWHFGKHGDLSYGLYIYAFPIQQLIFPIASTWQSNSILATAILLGLAAMSWHFVEKPCLDRKRAIAAFSLRFVPVRWLK
jgi:peptidoglycan/LPS O-acetylase OafA/YrhL